MAILFHFFVDSSQVIVVVVHWHLTSNSHLIEHSGLSPFPIKPVCWKGIQIGPYLGSWYKRLSGISQFIKQANNHHTGNVKFTLSKSLRTKFLFQDIIVFKGKSVKTCQFSGLGTHFKPAGIFQNTHFSSCHPRVKGKEWHHQRPRQSCGYSGPVPL